jgi:hypothetical protein
MASAARPALVYMAAPCGCRIAGRFSQSDQCTVLGPNPTGTEINRHLRTARAQLARTKGVVTPAPDPKD